MREGLLGGGTRSAGCFRDLPRGDVFGHVIVFELCCDD
jgi:hypothetical protein